MYQRNAGKIITSFIQKIGQAVSKWMLERKQQYTADCRKNLHTARSTGEAGGRKAWGWQGQGRKVWRGRARKAWGRGLGLEDLEGKGGGPWPGQALAIAIGAGLMEIWSFKWYISGGIGAYAILHMVKCFMRTYTRREIEVYDLKYNTKTQQKKKLIRARPPV